MRRPPGQRTSKPTSPRCSRAETRRFSGRVPFSRTRYGCPGKQNQPQFRKSLQPSDVMPGLVPGIHAEPTALFLKDSSGGAAWMAGTSPAMTSDGCIDWESSCASSSFRFSAQPCARGRRKAQGPQKNSTMASPAAQNSRRKASRAERPGDPEPHVAAAVDGGISEPIGRADALWAAVAGAAAGRNRRLR